MPTPTMPTTTPTTTITPRRVTGNSTAVSCAKKTRIIVPAKDGPVVMLLSPRLAPDLPSNRSPSKDLKLMELSLSPMSQKQKETICICMKLRMCAKRGVNLCGDSG